MNGKVLVVDDEPHVRKLITFKLQKSGFEIEEAGTVAEANSKLRGDFSLLVLDFMLPDGEGIAIAEAARDAGMTQPILLLSARADIDLGDQMRPIEFLLKPFDPDELVETVSRMIGGAS
jgi:DNA-binding response OmpR family regulator